MFLLLFLLLSSLTDQMPKSRKSILEDADGTVMLPGVLATFDNFNFDFLVECLGTDNNSGNN